MTRPVAEARGERVHNRIGHNTLWSALGAILPALAALLVVPGLTRALGAAGFGILAIGWALVGWFSVADLGLSRAVTQGVAQALAQDDAEGAAALTWTATAIMLPVSVAAAAFLWWLAPVAGPLLHLPPGDRATGVLAIRWIALAIPPTVGMTAWRGVLEGCRAFRAAALLRAPFGVAFAVVPWWLASRSGSVVQAVQGIALVRLAAWVAHLLVAWQLLPELRRIRFADAHRLRQLFVFGGWTTVSNVISPLMNTVDRVGLGTLVPVAALAPYAIASETATKIWLLSAIVVPVYYPVLAAAAVRGSADVARHLHEGSTRLLLAGLPGLIGFATLAEPVMTRWVGPEMGVPAAAAIQWLAIGLTANLVAQMSLAVVQAAGRPVFAAIGHLGELPLFVLALLWAVPRYGAVGAAAVWTGRALLDAAWLAVAAEWSVPAVQTVRGAMLRLTVGATTWVAVLVVVAVRWSPFGACAVGIAGWLVWLIRARDSLGLSPGPSRWPLQRAG